MTNDSQNTDIGINQAYENLPPAQRQAVDTLVRETAALFGRTTDAALPEGQTTVQQALHPALIAMLQDERAMAVSGAKLSEILQARLESGVLDRMPPELADHLRAAAHERLAHLGNHPDEDQPGETLITQRDATGQALRLDRGTDLAGSRLTTPPETRATAELGL